MCSKGRAGAQAKKVKKGSGIVRTESSSISLEYRIPDVEKNRICLEIRLV